MIKPTKNLLQIVDIWGLGCMGEDCDDCPSDTINCLELHRDSLRDALDDFNGYIELVRNQPKPEIKEQK